MMRASQGELNMKIEELQREFIVQINDSERKQLLGILNQHRRDFNFVDSFCKLLEGMDIL